MMIAKWVVMIMAGVDLRGNPLNYVLRSPVATSLDNVIATGAMVGGLATSMMQSAISANCATVKVDRDDTRSIGTLEVGEHRTNLWMNGLSGGGPVSPRSCCIQHRNCVGLQKPSSSADKTCCNRHCSETSVRFTNSHFN